MDDIENEEILYRLRKNAPSFFDIKEWIVKVNMINLINNDTFYSIF